MSKTSHLKLKCEVSRTEKKVQECDYVFGSSTTFQRRKEWICESRCRQVSVRLRVFARFFLPLNTSTTTVYAWSAFYPSLRFTLILQSAFYTQSAFYPWSAVCSPQSAFYTDRYRIWHGERTYLFCNLRKWKDISIKQLTLHKMRVTSLLRGPWADLCPFYGLYCKRFSLYT